MTTTAHDQRGGRRVGSTVIERELARRSSPPPVGVTRPWSTRELTRLLATLAFCAIGLGISWLGVSGTVDWRDQIIWTATGIGVVAVAGISIMSWLLTGFRAVRIRQSQMADGVAARLVIPEDALPADPLVATGAELVTVEGMTHAHRPGCLLVKGKATVAVSGPMDLCGVCG